jgi:hypothetical protein
VSGEQAGQQILGEAERAYPALAGSKRTSQREKGFEIACLFTNHIGRFYL